MENDLISRSALLKKSVKVSEFDEAGFEMIYRAVPENEIQSAPAVDAVKVVRCKDCAKRGNNECPMFFYLGYGYADFTSYNGYCDRGERMVDNG